MFITMRNLFFSWFFLIPFLYVSLGAHLSVVSSQCSSDQQQSLLLQLKNSLNFYRPLSTKLVKWNNASVIDYCSWEGVSCKGGCVTHLDLSSESITGGLDNSSALFSLQYMEKLNLAYNKFNYIQIPSQFNKLISLSYLNLSMAGFAGQVPVEISHLTRLVILDLSAVYSLGTPPLKLEHPNLNLLLGNLSEINELYLDGVNISAQGTQWCRAISSSLPNLRVLSLSYCDLSGPFHESLAKLQSLSVIQLDYNNISAPVPGFFSKFSNLTILSLRRCGLQGTFPKEIFQIPSLQGIDLSLNSELDDSLPEFPKNGSLETLELGLTNFSGSLPNSIGSLEMLSVVDIAYCNFTGSIPKSMTNLTQLVYLWMFSNNFEGAVPSFSKAKNLLQIDLSSNGLTGNINCIHWGNLTNLLYLFLDNNMLDGNIPSSLFSLPSLSFLSLSSNQFSRQFPEISNISSEVLEFIDLSNNNLEEPLMSLFNLTKLRFLSFRQNMLDGIIPKLLCNSQHLEVPDLSNNFLTGTVPECLSTRTTLAVLDLRRNNLSNVEYLSPNCSLQSLDMSGNHIEGQFLQSLVHCKKLEVLNLGHNQIKDPFPCFLKSISTLRVLILRSNKLYGSFGCPNTNGTWPMLQFIDLADNNFSGGVPWRALTTWQAMMANKDESPSIQDGLSQFDYQVEITVTMKGQELELKRILNVFTGIDFSCNKFNGSMLKEIGELKSLLVLNLSNNDFIGAIPSSLSNLGQLESLDLSNNNLSGQIPIQLTELTFLEVLNLSNNQLVGSIPSGNQFSTFPKESFEGNKYLWGFPLAEYDTRELSPPTLEESHPNSGDEIDWDIIWVEIGFTFGFGIAIGSLLFCKRWRKWYYRAMYSMLLKIFPQLEQKFGNHRRHVHINQVLETLI